MPDFRSVNPRGDGGRPVPLAHLLLMAGGGLVEGLASTDRSEMVPVHGVTVVDPLEPVYPRGHIVLVVGVDLSSDEAMTVIRSAAHAQVAAVVFSQPKLQSSGDAGVELARDLGLNLLARSRWAGWAQLVGALRAGLAGAGVTVDPQLPRIAMGDLDAVADAIAARLKCSVTIEDLQLRVLAYSSSDTDVDELRRLTILGRKVPQWRIDALEASGFFCSLWRSEDVLHRPAGQGEPERLIVAVRAGGEMLGSIWAAGVEAPFDAAAEVLRDCATMTVPHLLYHRSLHEGRNHRVEAAVRELLYGDGSVSHLAERAGLLVDAPATVLCVEFEDGVLHPGDETKVLELTVLHGSGRGCRTLPVVSGNTVMVLLTGFRSDAEVPTQTWALAQSLTHQLGDVVTGSFRIGVSDVAPTLKEIRATARTAEQIVQALRFSDTGAVARIQDVEAAVGLVRLKERLSGLEFSQPTAVEHLQAYDREHDTTLTQTLQVYLESFGSVPRAAERLGYHPNSLRYRLNKIAELCGIDLNDPDARLLAHVQLRLMR